MNSTSASADRRAVVVGRGRAGGSFATALTEVGWTVELLPGRIDRIDATDADLVLLCVPDRAVAEVAARVTDGDAMVAHVAGSLGAAVLGRIHSGVLHPLASLPDASTGAVRLRSGITFAVAGDARLRGVVADLGGHAVEVSDDQRVAYHAAACIASNHLVALVDQVGRTATRVGLPAEMYLPLIHQTLDNVERLGPAAALTGPAARGDHATLERHRALFDGATGPTADDAAADRVAYDAMADLCRRLAARS